MQKINGRVDADRLRLPPTPRTTKLSSAGAVLALACVAAIVGGIWGGMSLHHQAMASQRRTALAGNATTSVLGRVTRVQLQGGDDDRRTVVHYEYLVNGHAYRGSTRLRRRESHAFVAGGPIAVSYVIADPSVGWMEGRPPRRFPAWPAYLVPSAALLGSAVAFALLGRQRRLLADGRLAIATITRIDKKRSDKGSYWRVEYQWRLLSGATRRAHYHHSRKQPPAIGTHLPIIYDRDNPRRQRRYPLPLVGLRGG